ncbi:MAG: class I SAM-dependent rRNA methyltransferase [Clostridiales bacterium]|nr:class I SAM-dependent rRNA methyltransferase [Clostridiales bacterium]
MKKIRDYNLVIVSQKGERWLSSGHPWVYSSDVVNVKNITGNETENGDIVDVVSQKGKYIGTGFYNKISKIAVRIISTNANDTFNSSFWRRRVNYAVEYRLSVMPHDNIDAFRVIFGESDGFPGLTVDLFHNILSVQSLSYGIEKNKDIIYPIIIETLEEKGFEISGLYERNDVAIRELEGLREYKGWYNFSNKRNQAEPKVEITENGIKYLVDIENGQKTGFFLDQKFNRLSVAKIAKGKKVLDCFTHTGSFALNAAFGGAEHVTAVDVSKSALDMAKHNAQLNGLSDKIEFIKADVFDFLPALIDKGGHPFDFIILDPPAFTKSRKTAFNAEKGYKEINYRAMKLLPLGGYLATASCSHFMPHARFEKMLISAASDAKVKLKQIEVKQQGTDHPVMWNVPETDYLKFYIFQIVDF